MPGRASAGPGRGPGGLAGYFNLVMLAGIVWVFRAMRRGEYNETELERQLDNRGFFYRFFGITATSPHGSATAKGQP